MAYIPQQTGNYVKFIRGTSAAWENIKSVNEDTLYFIAEPDADRGKLYLGTKLISDGTINIVNSFSQLNGVQLSDNIADQSLLVYDLASNSWTNQPLEEVLTALVSIMSGASATEDGGQGLVPKPLKGQQGLFLRGDATWANPTKELSESIDTRFALLYGQDTAGTSIRSIAANEVAKIVANADQDFDTLKEIADWINNHDEIIDIAKVETSIEQLNQAVFGQEEIRDDKTGEITTPATLGLVSVVSTLQTSVAGLNNITETLNTDVTILKGTVGSLNTTVTNLSSKVDTLEEKLLWEELIDEDAMIIP